MMMMVSDGLVMMMVLTDSGSYDDGRVQKSIKKVIIKHSVDRVYQDLEEK